MPPAHRALGTGSSVPEDGADLRRHTKDTNTEGKPHTRGHNAGFMDKGKLTSTPRSAGAHPGLTPTPHAPAHTYTQIHTCVHAHTIVDTHRYTDITHGYTHMHVYTQ